MMHTFTHPTSEEYIDEFELMSPEERRIQLTIILSSMKVKPSSAQGGAFIIRLEE